MAIHRLLQQSAFGPEDIGLMVAAYEDGFHRLNLSTRSDPVAEILARKIIEIAQTGVRDPARMRELALKEMAIQPPSG